MDPTILLLIIGGAGAIGFYMAWSIGANDVANSMATAVGAKAITHKQAVLIAGVLCFVGAAFVSTHVTDTISRGIVDPSQIADSGVIILGFSASLIAAAFWVTLSTWKEMPISTTHSVVGALIGFGLVVGGPSLINWAKVGFIAASWLLSPVAGCILAFFVFKIIVKLIFAKEEPVSSAKIVGPCIIGITFFLITSSLLLKTGLGKSIGVTNPLEIIVVSTIICVVAIGTAIFLLRNIESKKAEDYETVERIFRNLQVITSCYVAFSIGANDVANAMGPVASIVRTATGDIVGTAVQIPSYLLVIGGIGIAIGCFTWGRKVMRTVGGRITSLNNSRGFSIDFSAATTVLIASKLGLPISTTHTVIGAVIGVGLARGLDAIDLGVIKKIITSWLLTLPIAAATSVVIFICLRAIV